MIHVISNFTIISTRDARAIARDECLNLGRNPQRSARDFLTFGSVYC